MNMLSSKQSQSGVRRKLLAITWDLYRCIKTPAGHIVAIESNDIPQDARVVHATFDVMTDRLILCVEHESFPEVTEGQTLTYLDGPQFSIYYDPYFIQIVVPTDRRERIEHLKKVVSDMEKMEAVPDSSRQGREFI